MRFVASAGTDVAAVCLFDPQALDKDFDTQFSSNPEKALSHAVSKGQAYQIETGADGAYLLHIFLDEPLPEEIERYAHDPIEVSNLLIPSGKLFFSGSEIVSPQVVERLQKFPGLGTCIQVPAGTYALTLKRTEYPDKLLEEQLKQRVGEKCYRFYKRVQSFTSFAVVMGLIAAITWFFLSLRVWMLSWLPALALTLGIYLCLRKSKTYRDILAQDEKVQKEYPSIAATLKLQ